MLNRNLGIRKKTEFERQLKWHSQSKQKGNLSLSPRGEKLKRIQERVLSRQKRICSNFQKNLMKQKISLERSQIKTKKSLLEEKTLNLQDLQTSLRKEEMKLKRLKEIKEEITENGSPSRFSGKKMRKRMLSKKGKKESRLKIQLERKENPLYRLNAAKSITRMEKKRIKDLKETKLLALKELKFQDQEIVNLNKIIRSYQEKDSETTEILKSKKKVESEQKKIKKIIRGKEKKIKEKEDFLDYQSYISSLGKQYIDPREIELKNEIELNKKRLKIEKEKVEFLETRLTKKLIATQVIALRLKELNQDLENSLKFQKIVANIDYTIPESLNSKQFSQIISKINKMRTTIVKQKKKLESLDLLEEKVSKDLCYTEFISKSETEEKNEKHKINVENLFLTVKRKKSLLKARKELNSKKIVHMEKEISRLKKMNKIEEKKMRREMKQQMELFSSQQEIKNKRKKEEQERVKTEEKKEKEKLKSEIQKSIRIRRRLEMLKIKKRIEKRRKKVTAFLASLIVDKTRTLKFRKQNKINLFRKIKPKYQKKSNFGRFNTFSRKFKAQNQF